MIENLKDKSSYIRNGLTIKTKEKNQFIQVETNNPKQTEFEGKIEDLTNSPKKIKQTYYAVGEGYKNEIMINYQNRLDEVYNKFVRKEENWKNEFLSLTNPHTDINATLPKSQDEVGSFFFSLSTYWVMLMDIKLGTYSDRKDKQKKFLEIFNDASEYEQLNKLALIDYIIKSIENNFTEEEILQTINQNKSLKEKKTNVYDVTKNDYKYFLNNPDFFNCLVPKYSSGKKLKTRETNSTSKKAYSGIRSNSKGRSSSLLNSKSPQKFKVNIEFPKDEVVNNLNVSINNFDDDNNQIDNHNYTHRKSESLIEALLSSNVKPILEEKNEDEVVSTNIINYNLNNLNKLHLENQISLTLLGHDRQNHINRLMTEIINSNKLQFYNMNLQIERKQCFNPPYSFENFDSFSILPRENNKKRLSFKDNYVGKRKIDDVFEDRYASDHEASSGQVDKKVTKLKKFKNSKSVPKKTQKTKTKI